MDPLLGLGLNNSQQESAKVLALSISLLCCDEIYLKLNQCCTLNSRAQHSVGLKLAD